MHQAEDEQDCLSI